MGYDNGVNGRIIMANMSKNVLLLSVGNKKRSKKESDEINISPPNTDLFS